MNYWKASTLGLAMALGLVMTVPALHSTASAEAQPAMKEALEHLRKAQASLELATSDKGGHRAAALKLVKKAIDQTKEGIEFDNKH
jgi:formate-dependent nitrite reductase cytochrome c552 subunit